MRLMHPLLSAPIHWKENTVPVLVAEPPKLFRQMVFDLTRQTEGEDGPFVLSLQYEPLDCGEHLHVICNYLNLPLEDRKLTNRFQGLLQSIVWEELPEQTDGLQRSIADYLALITVRMDCPIAFAEGDYVLPLLKALRCRPVLDGTEPLERLMQYLSLYNHFMKTQCFILVGMHAYFSPEELREFYRMAGYEKWTVLLLEQHMSTPLPGEVFYLLDEQLCELRLDSADQTE